VFNLPITVSAMIRRDLRRRCAVGKSAGKNRSRSLIFSDVLNIQIVGITLLLNCQSRLIIAIVTCWLFQLSYSAISISSSLGNQPLFIFSINFVKCFLTFLIVKSMQTTLSISKLSSLAKVVANQNPSPKFL